LARASRLRVIYFETRAADRAPITLPAPAAPMFQLSSIILRKASRSATPLMFAENGRYVHYPRDQQTELLDSLKQNDFLWSVCTRMSALRCQDLLSRTAFLFGGEAEVVFENNKQARELQGVFDPIKTNFE